MIFRVSNEDIDLDSLNSTTKYPSILTYHTMGKKGCLDETVQVEFGDQDVIITEKVDGTNARIIMFQTGDYIIGSREELLHAMGDRVQNPQLRIVEAVKPIANACINERIGRLKPAVLFGEVYGGNIGGNAKRYTSDGALGFRLFDAIEFEPQRFYDVVKKTPEEISLWRKHGNQPFVSEQRLMQIAELIGASLTPRLSGNRPPSSSIEDTAIWLSLVFPQDETGVALDDGAKGRPEGVVVRTASSDRSKLAKIRFQDYKRTLDKRKK